MMEKRTLIALALSFVVLGSYPVLLRKLYPDYYQRLERERKNPPAAAKSAPQPSSAGAPSTTGVRSELKAASDQSVAAGESEIIYNSLDGAIRKVSFQKFARPEDGQPLVLFSRAAAGEGVGGVRFVDAADVLPKSVTLLASGGRVTVQGMSSDGRFKFVQTYDWGGSSAKVLVSIENATDADQKLRYALGLGASIPPRNSIDGQYVESNFYERLPEGKKRLVHVKENKSGKIVASHAPVEWAAVKDRHFAVIVKPVGEEAWTGRVRGLGDHLSDTSIVSPEIVLVPKGRIEHEFLVYVGPVSVEALVPLGLDAIINFGKLDPIGRLLVGALELIQKGVRNWGLAVILLTIGINLLLFPLTRASFLSMKRMQALQPQMTKLRGHYKNQPDKLNKEMMELYKKNKVNPFGGCLPMVLQMPVFIALYVALSKSTILINAPFLWVQDLSTPDRVPLPFSLPFLGREIHVLPLIMAAGMAIQQRFTQVKMEGQDPMLEQQQKMMSVMMPVIFCFIFYTMPSGLVLYWLTNTVLMTAYQARLKKSKFA